jgi:hypothetical protein
MQPYKGFPNITNQPLLECLMKTHDNKYTVYVGNPNTTPHPDLLELEIHTPHETYNCQTLSLTRSLVIFIIPPSQTLTPSFKLH